MQSGIAASSELLSAFNSFQSDNSLFCLPVTITTEALTPLPAIPYPSGDGSLQVSLKALEPLLQPNVPIFLLVRPAQSSVDLTAITYIPSRSPVRSKTLFASTRATLVRELGVEKFTKTMFVTEPDEVFDMKEWNAPLQSEADARDTSLLSTEERELQAVKRAEDEARHGTGGFDLGTYGGGGGGSGGASMMGARDGTGASRSGVQMGATDAAQNAIKSLKDAAPGSLVQIGIQLATETMELLDWKSDVAPGDVAGHIPGGRPSYTFYSTEAGNLFIYVCPGASKVKERMVYAASRRGVLKIAEGVGVTVGRRLEAGDPEELGGGRIDEEVAGLAAAAGEAAGGDAGATETPDRSGANTPRGFARPKRPGKR